jgi:activator of HSP90 ATPase
MAHTIHQEVLVDGRADAIYEILMDSAKHTELTGGKPAEISREEGGAFSCHGGAINGRNIELRENQRIVQAWRVANWGEGEYSVVRIELEEKGDRTKVTLDHTGYPEGQGDMLAEGWTSHYWEPLHELVK